MSFVDLPLARVKRITTDIGFDYQVVRISSGYRPNNHIESCRMEEYVVRQQLLADHTMLLSTIMKKRKEVLEHGIQN